MSNAISNLSGYERTILTEVQSRGEVVGQFHLLTRVLNLPSERWGRTSIASLCQRGLIEVRPGGPRRSLIISVKRVRHVR